MKFFLVVISLIFVCSVMLDPSRLADNDLFWQSATGRWILNHRDIPLNDPFSWSAPGGPWIAHEWITEIIFAYIENFGPVAIYFVAVSLILIGLFIFWKLIKNESDSGHSAVIIYLLALFALMSQWTTRPQLFGFIGFFSVLYILQRYGKGGPGLWALPLLVLAWINFHLSALLGVCVVALYSLLSLIPEFQAGGIKHEPGNKKMLLPVTALSLLVTGLNPHGFSIWAYTFKTTAEPAWKIILEWQPPGSHYFIGIVFAGVALLITLALIRAGKVQLFYLILTLGAMFGAMHAVRHFTYFIAVSAVTLAQMFNEINLSMKLRRLLVCVLVGGLVGVSAANLKTFGLPVNDMRVMADSAGFPVEAVDWLKQSGVQRVMNFYDWGGYLIYRRVPVFIDGRSDFYLYADENGTVFRDWVDYTTMKVYPEEVAKKYGIEAVLLPKGSPQEMYYEQSGWKIVYADEKATIMQKN